MGELLQLKPTDFSFQQNLAYFDISADGQLKNEQSARRVPIHSDLLEWRLKSFVNKRKTQTRLLYDVKLGQPKITNYASQKFTRYMKGINLKKDGLVFHSFRHTFIDGARNANIEEAKRCQIVGQKHGTMNSQYGAGADIQNLYDLTQGISFGLSAQTHKLLKSKA